MPNAHAFCVCAPALFDYQWVNDRWESTGEYPFHCDDGSAISTTRSDFLTPNGDGSLAGERTFTVTGQGCPVMVRERTGYRLR
jgi:hypothetical protein